MKTFRPVRWALVCLFFLLVSPNAAFADDCDEVEPAEFIVFGDSLTDTGNMYNLSGGLFPAEADGYWNGRVSNGPVWIDHLIDPDFDPDVDEEVDTEGLVNYAFAGARAGWGNVDDSLVDITGIQFQIALFQADVEAGRVALDHHTQFILWAGHNDVFWYLNNYINALLLGIEIDLDPDEVVEDSVAWLAIAVGDLVDMGAKQILISNLVDMGLTPQAAYLEGVTELPIRDMLTGICNDFSLLLFDEMAAFDEVTFLDGFVIMGDLIVNSADLGIPNNTDPCLYRPDLNPDECVFWDQVHPTTAGHALIADVFDEAICSSRGRYGRSQCHRHDCHSRHNRRHGHCR